MNIEIGKSYLLIHKDELAAGAFMDKLISNLRVSPSDVILYEPSEGVETLRKAISSFSLKPHSSSCRILRVSHGERLNNEQANSLLKTIEEPPHYGLVIIFSKTVSRVLPTIKSRCIILSDTSRQEASRRNGGNDFLKFLSLDFNEFLSKIKDVESDKIPDMLNLSLESIKRGGVDAESAFLYRKIAEASLRLSSTNSNPRLGLEEIFVWNKARKK